MNEYFGKMEEVSDAISASGQNVSEEESFNYIIDGFGSEFDPAVVSIVSNLDSLTELK